MASEGYFSTDEDVSYLAADYWALDGRKDISYLHLPNQINYLITGGMSWGDDPTDAFDTMNKLQQIPGLYDLLEGWAHEDDQNAGSNKKPYLLVVWGDIEPEIVGPYATEQDRDAKAKEIRSVNGDEHGIYRLDMDGSKPIVGSYNGSELE